MTIGESIVASARSWLGTRFHHQGRLKKTDTHQGGIDCLGLLMGVARELDLRLLDGTPLILLDETNYSHYPDTKHLQKQLAKAMHCISADALMPGDILLINVDENPQHLAVVSATENTLGLIHAYAPVRAVVEHQLDEWWRQKITKAYRVADILA